MYYLRISIACFIIAIISAWHIGCDSNSKRIFNQWNEEYEYSSQPTNDYIDVTVPVRVRLYGNSIDKQTAWKSIGQTSTVQWATVSSDPPQIFGDIKQKDGRLFINTLLLGHELQHVLILSDNRITNPDN